MKEYMQPYAAVIAHELVMFEHLEGVMKQWDAGGEVKDHFLGLIKERSDAAQKIVSDLNLGMTGEKTRMLSHCVEQNLRDVEDLRNRMREVRETMVQELSSVRFLRATTDMESYLDKPIPFGEEVSAAFPSCTEDIAECHQCFALGRHTAAMFHLGRAMELVVKRLAKKMSLKVSRDEWQSYLNAMNQKIDKMPFQTPADKKRRTPYPEAAAYLLHFKEAWRNETMHPKKTYTRDEALDVINCASAFLRSVSRTILKAKKNP